MGLQNTKDNTYLNLNLSKFNIQDPNTSRFLGVVYKDKETRDAEVAGRFSIKPESVRLPIRELWNLVIDPDTTSVNQLKDEIYECLAITEEYGEDSGWVRED